MQSEEMQQARVWGITYRSDDYRNVIVLCGDKAIYRVGDGMGWTEEVMVDVEHAWNLIARRGLKLAA